ncbi:hypothetical protein S245_048337, partial [Arachis hypogaea]
HQARDFSADNFFSKHYLSTYYSYQMVYGTQDLQELVVLIVGDILDQDEEEIAILSLLRSLDKQAKAKGGAVFQ